VKIPEGSRQNYCTKIFLIFANTGGGVFMIACTICVTCLPLLSVNSILVSWRPRQTQHR
jgi:hypothetical protein